jgi:hypothetical protein
MNMISDSREATVAVAHAGGITIVLSELGHTYS